MTFPLDIADVMAFLTGELRFRQDDAEIWIAQPNLLLWGSAPVDLCAAGKADRVMRILRDMAEPSLTA